jgi:hypothetical protein
MAALAQPVSIPTAEEIALAEQTLVDIFLENLETLPVEQQQAIIADLRSNAAAHGE